jgi:hypothetical protein
MWKKIIGISVVCLLFITTISSVVIFSPKSVQAATYTITVDTSVDTGAIKYGGLGWLYGLGYDNVPTDSLITGLVHPQFTQQKPPGGLQHPEGDAFEVYNKAKRTGIKAIAIYCQDIYKEWPYPNVGIDSYLQTLEQIVRQVVSHSDKDYFWYVPFNEPDWIWYSSSGSKFTQFLNDWKAAYNKIKSIHPTAKILGPNFCVYNAAAYDAFFKFAKENNCLPDITTWHELDDSFFTNFYNNYNSYRSIEQKYGISPREVFINEYGRVDDISKPGRLIQFLSRFENTKVYGALAFWVQGGTLDGLTTTEIPSRPTGAWHLYRWYGQMSGRTVQVTLPSQNGPLQAIATKEGTNKVKVIFGGGGSDSEVFDTNIIIKGLSSGQITYYVYETNNTGMNYSPPPTIKKYGTTTVSNGQITISVTGCKALSAYLIDIMPSSNVIVSGATYKIINLNSRKALDVYQASTADGAKVCQWTDTESDNQKWVITDVGGGIYKIISVNSGKALDVYQASTVDGAGICQWTYTGSNNQKWQIISNGDGTFRVISVNSGKALDVYQASTADGAKVCQWTYTGGNNQKWILVRLQ